MSTDRRQLLSGYVIRGSEEMISDDFAQRLGYAFALVMAEKKQTTTDKLTVAVGHDARPSGKRIMRALIDGITAADSDIYDCGLATTPAIQMCIYMPEIAADGSIMVTGGSADEGINGFKFFTADGIFSAEEAAALYELAQHVKVPHRLVEKLDVFEIYKKRLRDHVFEFMGTDVAMPLLGLKVIVDASNGSAGFSRIFCPLWARIPREASIWSPRENSASALPSLNRVNLSRHCARRCWKAERIWESYSTETATALPSWTPTARSSTATA